MATPVEGQGHDYIHGLNETVNPATGSLSVRISMPVRKQVGATLPLSIAYDSTGMRHIGRWPDTAPGVLQWIPDLTPFHENGWSLTNASLTNYRGVRVYHPLDYPYFQCFYFTDYVFHGPSGEAHPLQVNWVPSQTDCPSVQPAVQSTVASANGDYTLKADLSLTELVVTTPNGNKYHFPPLNDCVAHPCQHDSPAYTTTQTAVPSSIEDRNGNIVGSGGSPLSFGSGAPGGTNTITVSGQNYTLQWEAVSASNTSAGQTLHQTSNGSCNWPTGGDGPTTAVQYITLPNGLKYQFTYESVYGRIQKITYPSGATVTYTWALNPSSQDIVLPDSSGADAACQYRYGSPAVTSRVVSFDGVNPALEQDFNYSSSPAGTFWNASNFWIWDSRTTIVVTKDCARNNYNCSGAPSFTTVYNYGPWYQACSPNDCELAGSIDAVPLESSVVYKDSNGVVLRTVTKNFSSPYQLSSLQTTLENNQVSETDYTYTYMSLPLEQDDYD